LTVPEVRRLLLALAEPSERFSFRLRWSTFRRQHQAVAKTCHAARRARDRPACIGMPAIHVLCPANLELTEERWAQISPLLPPQKPTTGRPAHDHRLILSGMLWVVRTGSSWRELPEDFGPWQTIHTRYQRWKRAGVWQRILDTLKPEDATDAY
jgi:Putative transposase of IS4/5 family (DUF4096)